MLPYNIVPMEKADDLRRIAKSQPNYYTGSLRSFFINGSHTYGGEEYLIDTRHDQELRDAGILSFDAG